MRLVLFYLTLPFFKVLDIFETKVGKFDVVKAQLSFYTRKNYFKESKKRLLLKTTQGSFVVRETIVDVLTAAPSFERMDTNAFSLKIWRSLEQGSRVAFLDIGANFGKYSITLANKFKNFGNRFQIFAFEPDKEVFELLQRNLRLNKIRHYHAFCVALSNKNSKKTFYRLAKYNFLASFSLPNSKKVELKTRKLDDFYFYLKDFDHLFIKMDVEGHELEVLKGATNIFSSFAKIDLLIEDTIKDKVKNLNKFLKKYFDFSTKITPQNSFWTINKTLQSKRVLQK